MGTQKMQHILLKGIEKYQEIILPTETVLLEFRKIKVAIYLLAFLVLGIPSP